MVGGHNIEIEEEARREKNNQKCVFFSSLDFHLGADSELFEVNHPG